MYRFNRYSSMLAIIYLTVLTTLECFSSEFSFESIYVSFPLIAAFIFWSERETMLIQNPDGALTKTEAFSQDLFLISFCFISGDLLSLLFQYDNSDTLGWWPLAIYFMAVFGILLAITFSLIALFLNESHKKYTLIYSAIFVLALVVISIVTRLDALSIFATSETFYLIFLLLIGIHLILCLGYKVIKLDLWGIGKVGEKGNKWQMNNQRIYIMEILKQSDRAIKCYQRLCYSLEHHLNEELFCEIEHFIQHAASISLLLWPSPSSKSKNKQQTKARGIYLRKLLEIKDNSLKDRRLRDHLVHIDERLDDWACESTDHNFIDQNIGNINQMISGIANTDYIRNFDPKTFEFNFLAEKFNLNEIYSSIFKLKDSLQNKALVL